MFRHLYLGLVALASVQQPAGSPAFEVASVKLASDASPSPPFGNPLGDMRMRFQGGPGTGSPGSIHYRGVTMRMLIQRAYDVEPFQVVGPAWMDGPRYNIDATLSARTSAEECKLMLRSLLAERFLLRQHAEARPFRVFQLVVSKGGPKLAPEKSRTLAEGQDLKSASFSAMAERQTAAKELGFRPTQSFFADSNSMAQLAARLSQFLDRPAVDMTGLSGTYSVSLSWVGDGGDGPSLEQALREQLGLELRPATQDLRVIVVDAAERNPTGN